MTGFLQASVTGAEDILGPIDLAQIHTSCSGACRNSTAIRMAHFPPHVLDFAAKCRDRVQGDAGTAEAFLLSVNIGRLHTGSHAGEACSASRRGVAGIFFRFERTRNRCEIAGMKAGKKGTQRARSVPFLCPRWFQ